MSILPPSPRVRNAFSLVLLLFLHQSLAPARQINGLDRETRFRISPRDTIAVLTGTFVLPSSVVITVGDRRLTDSSEYSVDPTHATVTFHPAALRASGALPDSAIVARIRYRAVPVGLKDVYRRNIPVPLPDSIRKTTLVTARPVAPFSVDDLFGATLQKSGSIVRGFTLGSNRDLSLNSGLRLQLSGQLTDDLSVVAALTDENSPLQPEGTTKTLQEVDKVFVELHGRNVSATLGDFNVDVGGTAFGSLTRKLQGARATALFETGPLRSALSAVGASPRGKYNSSSFQGVDGVQGPYRLYGKNNEPQIVVIAATERVFLNGERMTRGEGDDYTIDYSTAEVTFTPRRVITRASRITIDFEYSDRQYTRSFYAASAEESWRNDRWTLRAAVAREADNQNSPIDAALDDSDKAILRSAGTDPATTSRTGVTLLGPGKGQYQKLDTIVTMRTGVDSLITIYRFNPLDSINAVYGVVFSYVGPGRGNYQKITFARYDFTGVGRGDYLPIRFLPLPTAQTVFTAALAGTIADGLTVAGEFGRSELNGNLFSSDPSVAQSGSAFDAGLSYTDKSFRPGGIALGGVTARARMRHLDRRFVPIDRLNAVEFERTWNLTDSSAADQDERELTLDLRPADSLTLRGSFGRVSREDRLTSDRTSGGMAWGIGLVGTEYSFERSVREDNVHASSDVWLRQRGSAEARIHGWTPFLRYEGELLLSHRGAIDTLGVTSFRSNEVRPGLRIDSIDRMSIEVGIGLRAEDSLSAGTLRRAMDAISAHAEWRLRDWHSVSSMLDFSIVDKRFPARPDLNGDPARSIALRWQSHYLPSSRVTEADLLYELLTERTARLERVFQQVARGSGNYQYAGDLNGNHVVDEPDFRPVRFDGDFIAVTIPTDQLLPVTGVRAGSRIRLNGYQLSPGAFLSSLLRPLSSETYLRIDEKNSDPERSNIYLLRLSHFLNGKNTLAGSSLVSQDCYLFETNPSFSLRFRFNEAKGLTQFALGTERTYRREQSLRCRWQFLEEFSNQTDIARQRDILSANASNPRLRDVDVTLLTSDWSYRPFQRLEFGFRFGTGRGKNFDSVTVGLNDQSVRLVYALNDRGQCRADLSREEALVVSGSGALPFELTGGRMNGQSWLWHLAIDYRITRALQSSASYDGRREGRGQTIHTARAEVRAFF